MNLKATLTRSGWWLIGGIVLVIAGFVIWATR